MKASQNRGRGDHIGAAEARAELERLLDDCRFHATDRNRAFLRYIAEASLAGRSKGVKAYSVAVDVFGRPQSFDPNSDPIVRIEAARLRASLDRYYEAHGGGRQVRIRLPRGNYIAEFSRICDEPSDASGERGEPSAMPRPADAAGARLVERPIRPARWPLFAGIAGVFTVVGIGLSLVTQYFLAPGAKDIGLQPVLLADASGDLRDEARIGTPRSGLLITLPDAEAQHPAAALPSYLIISQSTQSAGQIKQADREQYEIMLKYNLKGNSPSILWSIVEPASGRLLASGEKRLESAIPLGANIDNAAFTDIRKPLGLRKGDVE